MKKRIIAASLAVIMAASFYACDSKKDKTATESDAETVSSTVTEAAPTTTTTTAPVTTTVPTTKPTTTKKIVTTTKKIVTTVKEVITTTEPTTVFTLIRNPKRRIERISDDTELKYGVYHIKNIAIHYEELEDGTEVVVKEEVTADYIDRTLYMATYDDLLPAAKENRETYRKQINEVLKIVNGYRAEGGLDPLKLNEDLTIIANVRAEELAWSGNHSHTRPNMLDCFSLMRNHGFERGTAGENIGWGFQTAKEVCEAWKASETHYENIMNPKFTEIGIGVAKDPLEGAHLCWSQYFYEG